MPNQLYTIQQEIMKLSKTSILFRSVLFVTKLRLTVRRFRKRRQLTKEWIDIENSNELYACSILDAVSRLTLNPHQISVISVGLDSILQQSKVVRDKLRSIVNSKGIIFGSAIKQICSSFQVYEEFLSRYLQKQRIISQLSSEAYRGSSREKISESISDLKCSLNENSQKLVFRTYHISLLLSGFIKCLPKKSQEGQNFQIAIKIMLRLNKKYDQLLKKEKKEMESERILKINRSLQGCILLSSIKAQIHSERVLLHIFQRTIGIEVKGNIQIVTIDRYCSIFMKMDPSQRLVCLITKPKIFHFFFDTTQDLNRFYKIVQSCIQGVAIERSVTQSQIISTFEPFIFAQLCDYRQLIDLKNSKDTYIQVLFASIKRFQGNEQRIMIQSSMRESMQWADLTDSQYNNQINELVTLKYEDLCEVQRVWSNQYQVMSAFPKYSSFNGRVSISSLKLLECSKNRSRIFINNPILLLKKLKVTDIFLETSEAQGRFSAGKEEQPHCRLCSRILVNQVSRYLAIRLDFLRKKYQEKSKQYCFLIFQQIRQQICKISIYQLKYYYQLIIWLEFKRGSIDYSFRRIAEGGKEYYVDVTILSIFEVNFQVLVNKHTLVSDVLDQVYLVNDISCLVGYRLVLHYSDKEMMLRPNELILPLLQYYNVKLDKLYRPSFFSTIGRLLQFSEKGLLVLKPIIFYPLSPEELIPIQWQQQYIQYQFKSDRLIGLEKKDKIEIAILLSIRQLLNLNKQLPAKLSLSRFDKFVPISLDEEAEDLNDYIQQLYSKHLSKTLSEVKELLNCKFKLSPLYKTYNFQVKVVQASPDICSEKKYHNLILGMGWNGLVFSTLFEKILLIKGWPQLQISLENKGLKIQNEKSYLIIKCPRILQIYRTLKQYQEITSKSNIIKQK